MLFAPRSNLKVGDAVPPFTLPAQDGRAVKLLDFRGRQRVVIAFYPEDDTPG